MYACTGGELGPDETLSSFGQLPPSAGGPAALPPTPPSDVIGFAVAEPYTGPASGGPATNPGVAYGPPVGCAPTGKSSPGPACQPAGVQDPAKARGNTCSCGQTGMGNVGCTATPTLGQMPGGPGRSAVAAALGTESGGQMPLPTHPTWVDAPDAEVCAVLPIPDGLRKHHELDAVYTRYASARGVPILASDAPQEEALRRACMMVRDLSARPAILEVMLGTRVGLVVMGVDETSADFPEFASWGIPDMRARGLGGVPRGLCAEENIMCDTARDRWRGESICIHEFSHTMHLGVYNAMDEGSHQRVKVAYRAAMAAGKFRNTYAASNAMEYFAEGVQDWYNTNRESAQPNGVHNSINTRRELLQYDSGLYGVLSEVLPGEPSYRDCYYHR